MYCRQDQGQVPPSCRGHSADTKPGESGVGGVTGRGSRASNSLYLATVQTQSLVNGGGGGGGDGTGGR